MIDDGRFTLVVRRAGDCRAQSLGPDHRFGDDCAGRSLGLLFHVLGELIRPLLASRLLFREELDDCCLHIDSASLTENSSAFSYRLPPGLVVLGDIGAGRQFDLGPEAFLGYVSTPEFLEDLQQAPQLYEAGLMIGPCPRLFHGRPIGKSNPLLSSNEAPRGGASEA